MSAATPPHAPFDPGYSIESDIPPREWWERDRDSVFYFDTVVRRVIETTLDGARGRVLDVACGDGHQLLALLTAGRPDVELYGIDLSRVMIEKSRDAFAGNARRPRLAWCTADDLPFASGSFDRVLCQGSLDHFPAPGRFFAEAARVLAPDGRLVVALQNFESASCRISRATYRLRGRAGMRRDDPTGAPRPYWQIPENHTFRGSVPVLRRLAEPHLQPDGIYGVSMFWLLPMWRRLLRIAPSPAANIMLRGANGVARRAPSLADMIISVWRRKNDLVGPS